MYASKTFRVLAFPHDALVIWSRRWCTRAQERHTFGSKTSSRTTLDDRLHFVHVRFILFRGSTEKLLFSTQRFFSRRTPRNGLPHFGYCVGSRRREAPLFLFARRLAEHQRSGVKSKGRSTKLDEFSRRFPGRISFD